MKQTCRICGCTDYNACYHPEYGNCWWKAKNLCSHCAMIQSGQIKKEDVKHLCYETACAYHACMGDECQYDEMKKNGSSQFKKMCE